MPINSNTAIETIAVSMTDALSLDAYNIIARSDSGTVLARIRTGGGVDTTDPDFRELDRRLEDGENVVSYITPWGTFRSDERDDWTNKIKRYIEDRDPFEDYQSRLPQESETVTNHFWYKRAATAPSLPTGLGTVDGIDDTEETVMTAGGWSRTIPTGTDTLWWTRVTYSVADGSASAQGTPPATDDIRYSTDDGETFSATAPADYDDVTDIETWVADAGHPDGGYWIEQALTEEVEDPFVYIGGSNWQNGGNGADAYNQYITIPESSLLKNNYGVGFDIFRTISWSNHKPLYRGQAWMPTRSIVLTFPDDLDDDDALGDTDYSTYLVRQDKRSGEVTIGLNDPAVNPPNAYSTTLYGLYRLNFLAYPKTEIVAAVSASASTFYVRSTKGLAIGDTIFIGDEQATITNIAQNPWTNGGYGVVATRGANGTTAAAHEADVQLRAIVNRDEVRYVMISHRWGAADNTQFRIFRMEKRGV